MILLSCLFCMVPTRPWKPWSPSFTISIFKALEKVLILYSPWKVLQNALQNITRCLFGILLSCSIQQICCNLLKSINSYHKQKTAPQIEKKNSEHSANYYRTCGTSCGTPVEGKLNVRTPLYLQKILMTSQIFFHCSLIVLDSFIGSYTDLPWESGSISVMILVDDLS